MSAKTTPDFDQLADRFMANYVEMPRASWFDAKKQIAFYLGDLYRRGYEDAKKEMKK